MYQSLTVSPGAAEVEEPEDDAELVEMPTAEMLGKVTWSQLDWLRVAYCVEEPGAPLQVLKMTV